MNTLSLWTNGPSDITHGCQPTCTASFRVPVAGRGASSVAYHWKLLQMCLSWAHPNFLNYPYYSNPIEYYPYYQYFIQKPKVSPAFCFLKWPFGVTTCFHHFSIIFKQTQTMMELTSIWSTMCRVFSWRNPWQYVYKGSLLLIEPGNEVLPRRRQWWDSNLFHNVLLDINIISNCWLGLRQLHIIA